ncbi:unnamed protein product, partial [Symbiodinium microadriaticum]
DGTEKTKFLRDLPVRPRPGVKPAAGHWLPLFTVRRPLFEGKEVSNSYPQAFRLYERAQRTVALRLKLASGGNPRNGFCYEGTASVLCYFSTNSLRHVFHKYACGKRDA